MKCIEYRKPKSQAAATESATDTYPSGVVAPPVRLYIEAETLRVFFIPRFSSC
jgi:hypothetical protein